MVGVGGRWMAIVSLGVAIGCEAVPPGASGAERAGPPPTVVQPAPISAAEQAQFGRLKDSLGGTRAMVLVRFAEPCWECRQAVLTIGDVPDTTASVRLSDAETKSLSEILGTENSYLFGLAKPCGPFLADYGILMPDRSEIFLISERCQTARLVGARPERAFFFNLDPSFTAVQRQLEGLWRSHSR